MTEGHRGDIGRTLREAREQSGVSLRQIADATKLSVHTLDCLERNRVSHLPGGIYRRNIVRSYAREIGLDPEQALQAFLVEHPQDAAEPVELQRPSDPQRSRRKVRAIASFLGAMLPVLAGLFYFTLSARGEAPVRRVFDLPPAVDRGDGAAPVAPSAVSPVSMTISLSAPCWLQVVIDGRSSLARRVEAGEMLRLRLESEVVLLGSDAGAVHYSINGRAGLTLGEDGASFGIRIARDDYDSWLMGR